MIRIAAIGTASTGKSAVLNAVFGTAFVVDARAGSTTGVDRATAQFAGAAVEVLDLPPLPAWADADVYLLICDKDLTTPEYEAAARVRRSGRSLGVVVNKSDTYGAGELATLHGSIRERLMRVLVPWRVVTAAAHPVRAVYRQEPDGSMVEAFVSGPAEVDTVRTLVRDLMVEAEGTVRVRARDIASRTAGRLSAIWRDRLK